MKQLFVNNVATALVGDLAAGDGVLTVANGAALPTPAAGEFFLLTLIGLDSNGNEVLWEIVKVTFRAGATLTVARGQEGTTELAWPEGTLIEARLTAGGMNGKEDVIPVGTAAQFWCGDKTWKDLAAAVRAAVLTGLSTATATVVVAADSVLTAIGKLQGQINSLSTGKLDATANAVSATKLATARTISLTGDVTGSVAFDGTGNVSLAASVADDSHNHVVANVDGLQAALDAKLAVGGGRVTGNLTVDTGIDGGYGNGNGGSGAWGACIWGMGQSYDGVGANDSFAPTSMYGVAWIRGLHASHDPQIGEGAYVYQVGNLKGGIGSAGIKTTGVFYGSGAGITSLNAANLASGTIPDARLSGTYTGVSITGNAATATTLGGLTATIAELNYLDGVTSNVQTQLNGKAASSHTHNYWTPDTAITGWYRSSGAVGWFNATYGGGIHMSDTTWVRVYNSKAFYVANQIAATGNITAYYSDERLKENIRPIESALDKVSSLNGVQYNANALAELFGYDRAKPEVGLLAQQVQAVVPEAVELAPFDLTDKPGESKSGEHYLTLKYERLVPLLVEAIKELKAEVDELRGAA